MYEIEIFPDAWPDTVFLEFMEDVNSGVLIAEYDGMITGYAVYMIETGEARLANIAVTPEFRGKSIAKTLLNSILDIAKRADCKNIFLDVRPSNATAIEFYRKFGFMKLYIRSGYYQSPVEDAIVMAKSFFLE